MNRRQFLKTLVTVVVAGPILSEIEIEPVTPEYLCDFKALTFKATEIEYIEYANYLYMRGIQYLMNDGTTGEWMGISREKIDSIPIKLGYISSDGSGEG